MVDAQGNTPLHLATSSSNYKIVRNLLIFKAAINIKNSAGNKPLDIAKTNNHKYIAKLFVIDI